MTNQADKQTSITLDEEEHNTLQAILTMCVAMSRISSIEEATGDESASEEAMRRIATKLGI